MPARIPSLDCDATPVCTTRFDATRERPPSLAVVEAIAAAEDVAPLELEPFGDEFDLEALDALFASDGTAAGTITLELGIRGWTVFVHGDGAVRVCVPSTSTASGPDFEHSIEG